MKKAKIIGKKTLSVFLAVLMVLTAWVWVAPTEAEAANGSYYIKITWNVVSSGNLEAKYPGKGGANDSVGFTVTFNTDNGRNSTTDTKDWDVKSKVSSTGNKTETATIGGFPTEFYAYLDDNRVGLVGGKTVIEITKIEIGASSSSTLHTIWSGKAHLDSTNNGYYITITPNSESGNNDSYAYVNPSDRSGWVYPYVPSANSTYYDTNKNVSDIGIPPLGDSKDIDKSTHSIQYYAYDNYGVRYEPTSYSVSGVPGLTTGTGWSCGNAYPITATTSTTKSTTATSQTATVTMNWNNGKSTSGQKANTTATFKVYNPRYKITFNGNGGTLGTGYTWGYYYRPINHSTSTATSNNVSGLSAELFPTTGIKEGYSFKGMFTAASGGSQVYGSTTITDTKTYYAQWDINNYTATFYGTKANDAGTGTVEYVISTSTVPYNTKPTAPTTVDSYSLGDYDYIFNNTWDSEITNIGVNGAEYRAGYDPVFVEADYSAVNEIIAEAQDIINSENYESIYSESSREKLETAVGLVDLDLGRTSQSIVDGYVTRIREAIDGLGRQKYSVIFIDQTDNSVIEMRYPVYYGDAITMPADPVKGFDSNYHYRFHSWQPSESGDDITFVSKNMIIYATFDKIAHTYTDTQLPSNCTTQAGVLHKCSCGYEYVEYSGSVGTEHALETEWTIDIAPTCTSAGSKSYHCTRCSYRDSVTEIPALGHDLVYQGVVISPGCENDGAEVSECQRCGYDNYTIIPSGNHIWTEQVIAPTCTSSGYTIKTCSICGDEDIVSFVDPIAHTYVENTDEYIAPTCTGLGKKVSYCSCGAQKVETVDATGHQWNTEPTTDFEATCTTKGQQSIHCSVCDIINQESITEIPENGHTWGNEVCEQKETCGVKGLYVKTCTVCGEDRARTVEALAHNYDTSTVAPTCTTKGYTVETCSNCGDVKYTNETPALNHAWTSTRYEADCTHSAYIEHICGNDASHNYVEYVSGSTALTHDFDESIEENVEIVKAATCTEDGEKTVKCTRCDAVNEVIIPKLGHSYGAWVVEKEATNNEDGKWTRTCSKCNDVEEITIPKGGHEWDNGAVTKAATCTKTGIMVYKCTVHTDCGITIEVTIPVTQHSVAQRETPATCTKTGTVEAYCTVCNQVLSTEEIPVVPHTLDNGTAFAPTCTTSGYTLYKCTADGCSFSYKEYDASKPATVHTYTSAVTKDASCTEEGVKTFTCSCGASYTETIPATGHTYVKGTVTAANCTTAGTEVYTCSCGDTYTKFIEAAKGHTYTNWEVVTPATADKSGVQKGTCACGDVKYDVLAPIGNHTFTETVTKNPTCTEKGEKSFTCSAHIDCSANYTAEIPATGHTQKIVYTAPTCIAEGSSKVVCSVCSAEILSTSIPATGIHDFSGEGVITAPGCTTEGEITYTCKTDGCTATKKDKIPAKGHSLSTTVNHPTCGVAGSVVTECKNCNDPAVEKTVELAAKGHIWKDNPESTVDADCENNGSKTYKCQNCEETNVVVLPKLGHNWSDWTKVDATTTADGYWRRTCSNCNEVETLEIPKGHNLVIDTVNSKAATCNSEGKTVYICNNHTDCGITITVDLPKLQHTVVQRELEATCKAEGSVEAYCSVCNEVLSTEVIPVKAHVYTAGTAVDATCTTSGYTPYTCSGCNDTYNKYDASKPATGHTFDESITSNVTTTSASCTADGSKTVKCKNCAETKTEVLPKTGHNYTVTATTDATCKVAATKTYKCDNEGCNSTYVEYVSGTAEHTWGNWTTIQEVTTTSHGIEKRECSVCGVVEHKTTAPTGAHEFENKGGTPATCTSEGSIIWECKTHTNCEANYTETLDKLPHTEKIAYTAPTCIAVGYSKIVCKTCGTEMVSETIPVIYHDFSGAGVKTDATCTSDGVITYTCETENCTATKTETIPAKGHDLATTVEDATCTKKGSVKTECSRCGKETLIKELPVIEHTWNSGTETKAATCIADGVKTYTCSVCDATKTETIAKLGHVWGKWTETKASTNDAVGEMKRTCERDGCTASETVEIPAGGHNLVETSRDDASCTKEGSVTYTCNVTHEGGVKCGISVTVPLAKTQHVLETTKTDATCEGTGSVITKCKNCDTATITTTIPATGHTYDDGVKTTATCTQAGYTTFKCKTCGHSYDRFDSNPLQHTYETKVTAPTCTTAGYTTYICSVCKQGYTSNFVNAKGHSYTGVETAPTCTEAGYTTYTCACGESYIGNPVSANGHNWGDWEVASGADGDIIRRTCKTNADHTEEYNIPAGGHEFDTSSPTDTTTGNCKNEGTKTFKCTKHTDCGVEITVKTELGAHDWTQWTKLDATNTEDGSWSRECKLCNTKESHVIPAGNHSFKETPDSVEAATCSKTGTATYKCTNHANCGVVITVKLDKVQHTPKTKKVDSTCTVAGYVKTYCEKCDEVISNVALELAPHIGVTTETVESTCITQGTEVVKCSCGETVSEKKLPLKAHDYDVTYENGVYTYTCKQEGCKHSYTETVDIRFTVRFFDAAGNQIGEDQNVKFGESAVAPAAPEKKADGTYHYEFSAWDRNYGEITSDLDVYPTYEKEAHYGGEATCKDKALCDKCGTPYGETDDSKHVIATKIKSATCEESGTITYYCSEGCGKATTVEEIKPMGHDFGEWEIYQAGNCAAPTIKIRKCRNYGCDKHDRWEIENSHNWHIVKEIPPTCTAVGYSEYKYCLSCGTAVDSVKIPALGHRDNNGDGRCDYCTYVQNEVKCNCMCHSTGFMKFIYSIVRFFWRLTKSTPSCSCGARHY